MKKIVILLLAVLIIIVAAFGFYLYFSPQKTTSNSGSNLALQEKILKNSSWIYLTEEDFYGYLNGTYTDSVNTIISSLEEATPVIFQTSNDKFGNSESGTFIVASAFNTSSQVYTYHYNGETNSYQKSLTSLENLLEDANAVFIYNETEELQWKKYILLLFL